MAVFPPTDESTMARSVVGIWIKPSPRRYVDAAKPVRSPTTPPPSATSASVRVSCCVASASRSRRYVAALLELSPCGKTNEQTRKPAASRLRCTVSPYSGHTASSETIIMAEALVTPRICAPALCRSPRPIKTSYCREAATCTVFIGRRPPPCASCRPRAAASAQRCRYRQWRCGTP